MLCQLLNQKNTEKETKGIFAIFASFVGKLKFLASKISPSFQHNAVDFSLTSAISQDSMLKIVEER